MLIIDTLFQTEPGYILDFSNRTFAEFFAAELDIDIYDDRYATGGTSKANRLRTLLRSVDGDTAAKIINALWDYRQTWVARRGDDPVKNAWAQLLRLLDRIGNQASSSLKADPPAPFMERERFANFKEEIRSMWNLNPQERGYRFEVFLKNAFDAFGMKGRSSFRLVGEQIDGSFELNGDTYLVEAKWTTKPTGVGPLDSFQGRVDRKASWTRGCFISYGGFSSDGLHAFGNARKVICVEGKDLHDIFNNQIPLDQLIQRKVRFASETGNPFAPAKDLFGLKDA
ncbi:MAG: restriction endonuclease [Verrucomicrobiales bacterium]|nr:restriction endonuclease [Verrucomicrobiales bacterium]